MPTDSHDDIVAMVEHAGTIFVATKSRVYQKIAGVFWTVPFADGACQGSKPATESPQHAPKDGGE
ncbi:MAG: hypothetical protein MUP44_06380 [Anaerolineales bacterium]|nr:hypothetical protein [Anaerolineales bacterium]